MKATLRRTFITGLVIVLPLFVTAWVVYFMFRQIDGVLTPVVLGTFRALGLGGWSEVAWIDYLAPLVSVALALSVIYLLGLVGGNVLGRQVLANLDRAVMQVPFVRGIYSAIRQFLDTFSSAGSKAFQKVVLVQYPRRGLWTLALVTSETRGEVQHRTDKRVIGLFVPTTPNPTSGWLLFVPEEEVVYLDMTVDDAFKMIISGGVLTPKYTPAVGEQPWAPPLGVSAEEAEVEADAGLDGDAATPPLGGRKPGGVAASPQR